MQYLSNNMVQEKFHPLYSHFQTPVADPGGAQQLRAPSKFWSTVLFKSILYQNASR